MQNEIAGLGIAVAITIAIIIRLVKGPRFMAWFLVIGMTLTIFIVIVYKEGFAGIVPGIFVSIFMLFFGRYKLHGYFAHKEEHNQIRPVPESKELNDSVEVKD
jgi:hypothetical protein